MLANSIGHCHTGAPPRWNPRGENVWKIRVFPVIQCEARRRWWWRWWWWGGGRKRKGERRSNKEREREKGKDKVSGQTGTVPPSWLSLDGRVQQERNVEHFTLQQQSGSRLNLVKRQNWNRKKQKKKKKKNVVMHSEQSGLVWFDGDGRLTSGNRERRSEKRPDDWG